ncbi:hypothetical protein LJC55_03325 [Eubacteriales bacterium OttesenSCG-928-N14]|nr:hypothetical protein [Eubacteriales bacterium OttesenSCG-928-N14]
MNCDITLSLQRSCNSETAEGWQNESNVIIHYRCREAATIKAAEGCKGT